MGSQLSLFLFGNEIQAETRVLTTTTSPSARPLKLTAGTQGVVSSSRHRALTILSCALDSFRPHAPVKQAYLGKLRLSASVSPLPKHMDLHLDGASWMLQELSALLLATDFTRLSRSSHWGGLNMHANS